MPDENGNIQRKMAGPCSCGPGTTDDEITGGPLNGVYRCCGSATPCNQEERTANGVPRQPGQDTGALNNVIRPVSVVLTPGDTMDHILARLGQNRAGHRVEPGLYSVGSPGTGSPVIVTANYTLSFDAVRSSLAGHDAYILVLDTKGINVWCAAGKGTFGTDELIYRIRKTGLSSVVNHHRLILPQLGAPGVEAHVVHKVTGFHIEYGPVRASDLHEFLKDSVATTEMREVRFDLTDRVVLIPVELRGVVLYTAVITIALWFLAGWLPATGFLAAVLAGTVIFPVLLPFLPTTDFSTKGLFLGVVVAAPFAAVAYSGISMDTPVWIGIAEVVSILSIFPVVTGYLALNFTGCTPYTSRTGVRREIFRYIPFMAVILVIGVSCAIANGIANFTGTW